MKYERLTERRGSVIIDNCKNCDNVSNPMGCTEHCCYEVMKNRLAELEDKIEQGKLIELPFINKVYEKYIVTFMNKSNGEKFIYTLWFDTMEHVEQFLKELQK